MNQLVYLVPLLPLAGFLINGLLRKSLSKRAVSLIGCGVILVAFLVSLSLFWQVKSNGPIIQTYFNFIDIKGLIIPFSFQVDALSALFMLIITGVGFLIHVYSTSYMHEEAEPHFARYFSYLNLFVFSMLLLVMGGNYLILFLGWEGVGLCSYLLIGYWFKNNDYNYAAKKAFIMNRIGDVGFLLGIFWLIAKLGTLTYGEVFAGTGSLSAVDVTGITLLFFIGATGKSAQIPLYTWLPDAMAGPTPVSALIHAATMVTAGVYMIARSNVLYSMSAVTENIIAIIGVATALLAATIAIKQNDIKKVLAYSTVSQLGYMFLGLGVGAYSGAVFHVMTHAFFKALLFLGAGSVIHAMGNEQDIRKMGGLRKYMPVTHITFLLACLAISGIPPFSGFFSKDEILAAAYAKNPVYWVLGVAGAALTAFYIFRLYATTFLGNFRGTHDQEHHLHESPAAMTFPLILLAILSVIGGWVGIPTVMAPGANLFHHLLQPVLTTETSTEMPHATEWLLMGVSVAIATIAILFALGRFTKHPELEEPTGVGKFLANKWYIDELYDGIVVKPLNRFAGVLKNIVEKSGLDGVVNGVGRFVLYASRQVRLIQSGQVGGYILFMVLAMIVLVLIWINDGYIYTYLSKIF
ncbi:MAG: NADH-quinone oxidoreductase subunit L [Hydrotalea flava]|uniref:NADH-quinone oxidoreductase subunit L n=1 Tax=Hydrotalea TaxID=1004300 RepID=UPI0009443B0E|nr:MULTISPECIES: NADH-quinone oxidoreductase subunit L [Hydrotalea]MBY0347190.1 NADH-quinone oxidoreductase subunit L [Hydrotalea flava]GHV24208.1 NADH dehydrogenase subunit L [Spirochaetia bacterium]NIM34623.1 NADH-quinone oxidoreductase subunit L [Hydrotalea flava]NIM37469.1 NADH-quinone oxidoreductase subunit L [Hydrotalea flava]NIN02663.1 NADH-quinone oxidoreductase subunit L [Hydrotalea flava]